MCTLSWTSGRGFRAVLFNRDENRQRAAELPPRVHAPRERPRYAAPLDPTGGGTWIAANEYGLAAAVLNLYEDENPAEPGRASRGTIPVEAVGFRGIEEARDWMEEKFDPTPYAPFALFVFDGEGGGRILRWNGRFLRSGGLGDNPPPIATSSFRPAEIAAARRELYEGMTGTPPLLHELLAFHSHHDPDRAAVGPAMVRGDATTRSLTVVRIGASDVSLRHQAFDPVHACFHAPSGVRLPRRILP